MSKCNTCIYRAAKGKPWKCEYITIMGQSRNCEPGDLCVEYEKGDRIKVEEDIFIGLKYLEYNNGRCIYK